MAKSVVGLFTQLDHAHAALRDLEQAGFSSNVSLVSQPSGQLSSLLGNAGIPQQDAAIYADGVQQGGALLVLQALGDQQAEQAAAILDQHHVVDISGRHQNFQRMSLDRSSSNTSSAMNTNMYHGNEVAIPIVEEELHVGKREVESGGVRVNTRVEEMPVNEQVTLRDEEVDVHRRRVDRPVTDADLAALQSGTFEVRETDEQAIVDKQARVVEEVVINKDVQQRTQTIQDTVRRTDVDVQELGGTTGTTGNEGIIERGASGLGNTIERGTGTDLDNDGDVGQRDTRNNY